MIRKCAFMLLWALQLAAAADLRAADAGPQRMLVEVYWIAPGQHQAFLEAIARYDEANRLAGLPPRQLFVHSEGASWDFMLLQPAEIPPEKSEALAKAWKELGLPSGADFFLSFRKYLASHEDSYVNGPTSAADYLATRKDKQAPR